ncbi:hypothetical protein Tco_1519416 [Tanacetum coccineum]
MARLPRCDELRQATNSGEWEPMMILYYRRAIAEDYILGREINRICGELAVVVREMDHFIEELDVLAGRRVLDKTVEFLKETQAKNGQQILQLQILVREMELRAREKDIFIQKLKGLMDF